MSKNPITKILGIKYPLIQAPLNWLTDAKFVAAVSNAGGLGTFGPNAGKTSPEQDSMKTLTEEIKRAQQLTDKPFAVNLMVSSSDDFIYPNQVFETALAAGVRTFVLSGFLNTELIKKVKKSGSKLIVREMNSTVSGAKEAEKLGADVIVATGYDEGGVIPTTGFGTFTTVPRIVDAVSIPVIAAGGVTDVRGVRAAFALGAQGVYVGTRLIVTNENRTAQITKEKIVDSGVNDILLVAPNQRSIKNAAADKWAAEFDDGDHETFAATRKAGGVRPAMLDGKINDGVISFDVGIDNIHEIKSVWEVVDEMMADFK
ncbi:NAD(P)H-dependent flavin oxidoreductase [Fructilactobacillus lindneri]|nr:nitronate monooxygenase [Fructilactobacillus lindneri]POH05561.1 2-nitropropane dioxygenase [Fructilactobacillus lindneri]POH23160.1 2-nitropropane dioxygenase [Fructilactobacillus lindneri DSM 20690 = JCM 11027]SKA02801.1 enoyl-[acyl-carrier protein] reductase II [Fructilactobacillus lindneri DSM 20690 = JCM 11027]